MTFKKFTAWILFATMLVTMLPGTFVMAAGDKTTPAPYPIIVTDVFSEMTNDINGVDKGTDLDLTNTTNSSIPTANSASGCVIDEKDSKSYGVDKAFYLNQDSEINNMRRKQILTFVAKSQDGSNFINSPTSTGVAENAVKIAYLDADRNPLVVDVKSEKFAAESANGDWSKAWIDLSKDVQQTDRTLETFLTKEIPEINPRLLTAAQLFATGDMVSFMIYNVIRSDFSGYLRIMITDNKGNITVQDYPIVADGQYPAVSIRTSTNKNAVGANVEREPVTTVAENTFISETDFVTVMEDTEQNKAVNETDNIHKSYRWHSLDTDALQKALDWEDENYKPEKIWAMDDITVEQIEISDLLVTSGIKSVKYAVENYGSKKNVTPSTLEGTIDLTYDPATNLCTAATPIVISGEGFNVLAITAVDNSGLKTTSRYYFYIDKTVPVAKFDLVELPDNVASLFTAADVVTNRQQSIDMSASSDAVASVEVISGLQASTKIENANDSRTANAMYQYRLLATKKDAKEGGNVPDGYTATVVDKKGNNLGGWQIWTANTELPVIDKEFDGIIQVRVQDRAGNWSDIVSETKDGKETIIADNTNPVITVKEYALNTNGDTTGNTVAQITDGSASDILVHSGKTEEAKGQIENEVIHTTTGDEAPWINDSAVLEVKITDKDFVNKFRSSGLADGKINVKAEFNSENQTKEIKIWNKNGVDKKTVKDSFDLTADYIFGDDASTTQVNEADKDLTFYIEYEGTGVVDITVSVKDQADVNDGDVFSAIYSTQLKVDKINPYIIYKGYDITDDDKKDLLKVNNNKVDYEVRDMPWGPNSQVLEVVVKDDDITPVQSKTKTIKFNSDKAVDLYKTNGSKITKVKSYAAGKNNVVSLSNCEKLENKKYEDNAGYKFYLVYAGTGIAKIEFFADDSAKEANVRNYPSVATAASANPIAYDAMLRVDKLAPKFVDEKLVEVKEDVKDVVLFGLTNSATHVTRNKMVVEFGIDDTNSSKNSEQSGVTLKSEEPIIVKANYNELAKDNLYKNVNVTYKTDADTVESTNFANDPLVEYLLIEVKNPDHIGTAGTFELPKDYKESEDWVKADKNSGWHEDMIVLPEEFQGAIVLRTTDRVGNVVYSKPLTVVAESKSPLVKFETVAKPDADTWEVLNQYGWAKRDVYFEVKVKDQTDRDVNAGLEKVYFAADVDGALTDADGKEITTAAKEISLSGKTADKEGYISLGYVKATKSSTLTVTVYDKALSNGATETGNKTVATYNVNIEKDVPVVKEDAVNFTVADNNIILDVDMAAIEESNSGLAPLWGDSSYNKHNGFEALYEVNGTDETGEKLSYYFKSSDDVMDYNSNPNHQKVRNGHIHEVAATSSSGEAEFNANIWEIPGIQYALIPENGKVADVEPWDFAADPDEIYSSDGYYNKTLGETNVWHNYVPGKVVANADFDGYIVVRVVDKAGNITILGSSSILDIEFNDDWKNDTQFIQVKASEKNGPVTSVEYYGNNDLLYPDGVHRSLTEALSGEGAFIEVVNEGITNVVIKSKTDIVAADSVTLSDWEGAMNVGSLNKDWKYQFVDVKIDKTAPKFDIIKPENEEAVHIASIKVVIGNQEEKPSGVKTVEWCAVPYGTSEEKWKAADEKAWETGTVGNLPVESGKAFSGTIKVRVTDMAGNVTTKTQLVNVDKALPIISISNASEGKCSHEPVTVFVTVSESADFSDITSVEYETILNGEAGKAGNLTLTGGTITIADEGETIVKVTAKNKSGDKSVAETTVNVHYNDINASKLKGKVANGTEKVLKSGDWVVTSSVEVDYANSSAEPVWYSLNGGNWTKVAYDNEQTNNIKENVIPNLEPGENTIRIQARKDKCLCKSDVVTYVINYAGEEKPNISFVYDSNWKRASAVTITSNRGESASDVESISYHLFAKNASANETKDITGYLNGFGGTITIPNDGKWTINNVIVTMESGVKYKAQISADNKFTGMLELMSKADSDETAVEVAKVDTIAPIIVSGDITLEETAKDMTLFAYDKVTNKETKIVINSSKISNGNNGTAPIETFKYALVEKELTEPKWEDIIYNPDTMTVTIKNAFEGTVLVKVIDHAGNETVWSNSLLAEGNAPEIAITAPYGWVTEDALVNVTVSDKGYASGVGAIQYVLVNKNTGATVMKGGYSTQSPEAPNPANFTTDGGQILIGNDGLYELSVTAQDRAGNEVTRKVEVKVDKTAPTYSGSVEPSLFNVHTINNWDNVHDGWTYNHAVDISGITDSLSGVKEIKVKATTESGVVDETTLNASQTGTSFSTDGKYDLTITDNAGNVRNISFVINKDLRNVINVVGVDAYGKVNIAVTDGNERLSFYSKEDESGAREVKMFNGVTDQIWDGKTGVKYIYAKNDSGKTTNKLHLIIAPSNEYGITLMNLDTAPNRYLDINTDGSSVSVKKVAEIFNPNINKDIYVGSTLEINEDGVYSITTND
ncbi:MAG: hypothetical protein IKJ68_07395 [Clostridia bacterium]|nr:hypothetical protein [Clostridia bacterium]